MIFITAQKNPVDLDYESLQGFEYIFFSSTEEDLFGGTSTIVSY